MKLSQRRLNRAVLARQGLLERRALDLPAALDAMGGLQAQYAPSMYIGLWSRVKDLRRDAVTEALNEREIIQATLMRFTIHLVSAADYWPLALAIRDARRALWERVTKHAPLDEPAAKLREALKDGPLRRKEIEAVIGKDAMQGIGAWVDLVRVPPQGTWEKRRADNFGLAEDWLPQPAVKDPLRHLVARYLTGFGPAAQGDIANWAGMTNKDVAPALEGLDTHEAEDGTTLYDLPGLPLPDEDTAGAGAVPAHLGRDAARPRPPCADPARGAARARLPRQDAAVDRHVPRRRAGRGHVETGRHGHPVGGPDRATTHPGGQRSRRVGRVHGLTLYVCAVHAGPFTVFVEEAHEDSADLLFLPEATAADWATVFSYAEVLHVGAGLAVVQAGEHDRALYLLTDGAVGVRLPRDEGSFKTIEAPSVLGELSFFDGYPRSATLEAATDVEVVRIDLAAFDRLHEHEPAIANLMLRDLARILALRLRLASAVIADLRGS